MIKKIVSGGQTGAGPRASKNPRIYNTTAFPMTKQILKEINYLRVLLLSLLLIFAGSFVLWDRYRVIRDFSNLKSSLIYTRIEAFEKNKILIVKFIGKDITITDDKTGVALSSFHLPTLHSVNYDTKLGKNMIVFSSTGTSPHNLRIHGGDLTLRSWLGFRKNIAVNCTGLVSEGLYPAE